MNDFLERLQNEVMLGDGAMGTLLYQRGVPLEVCYDAQNVQNPLLVEKIHRDYVAAGAQVIETNTYGANRAKLARFGLEDRLQEINRSGAALARQVADQSRQKVYVAGSVGAVTPAATEQELTDDERRAMYREQISALLEGGVDVIILETFTKLSEIKLALEVQRSVAKCPVISQMSYDESGRSADGLPAADCLQQLRAAGADVIGFNCQIGPRAAFRLMETIPVEEGTLLS
ncbi:MAG: bifunctional homocysteine S-methyltransferase/methylenetetrahydrofolate reductase, partial [Verrucomicrobia bacterium]|nr:bifunctional homocysteine S-methyltransferase/methylenetetrahydrofolate reductase [Verrucomicrobiota bacterium]